MTIQILFIVGLALITIGIAFIYWPAAFIFAGVTMSTIAFEVTRLQLPIKPALTAEAK
jgi:hypothetical protein